MAPPRSVCWRPRIGRCTSKSGNESPDGRPLAGTGAGPLLHIPGQTVEIRSRPHHVIEEARIEASACQLAHADIREDDHRQVAGAGGRSQALQRRASSVLPDAKIDVKHLRPWPGSLLEDALIVH